jgi:hypothetical protein
MVTEKSTQHPNLNIPNGTLQLAPSLTPTSILALTPAPTIDLALLQLPRISVRNNMLVRLIIWVETYKGGKEEFCAGKGHKSFVPVKVMRWLASICTNAIEYENV